MVLPATPYQRGNDAGAFKIGSRVLACHRRRSRLTTRRLACVEYGRSCSEKLQFLRPYHALLGESGRGAIRPNRHHGRPGGPLFCFGWPGSTHVQLMSARGAQALTPPARTRGPVHSTASPAEQRLGGLPPRLEVEKYTACVGCRGRIHHGLTTTGFWLQRIPRTMPGWLSFSRGNYRTSGWTLTSRCCRISKTSTVSRWRASSTCGISAANSCSRASCQRPPQSTTASL